MELPFLVRRLLLLSIQRFSRNKKCSNLIVSHYEARSQRDGYLEDLIQEGAMGISVEIKHCRPESLTIFEDE